MNNEHYDDIGRTEDFSMMASMDDGKSFAAQSDELVLLR
jgi:hypothetical protein